MSLELVSAAWVMAVLRQLIKGREGLRSYIPSSDH